MRYLRKPHFKAQINAALNFDILHSALIRNLIKLKGTRKLTVQGEGIFFKDSKYILFEVLANRTWKGSTSACQPSQPNHQNGLAWPAGACTAPPCPMS